MTDEYFKTQAEENRRQEIHVFNVQTILQLGEMNNK